MGRIRNAVLGFVADLVREAKYDELGEMSVQDALDMLNTTDMTTVTVAQVERVMSVASLIEAGQRTLKAAPGLVEVTDPDTIRRLAEKYGLDPSSLVAYQGASPAESPAEQTVPTINGPVKLSEVPLDENGEPEKAWVDKNCGCEEHRRMREVKARVNAERKSREGTGGYV